MLAGNVAELHRQSVLLYKTLTCPKTYKILHHLFFRGPLRVYLLIKCLVQTQYHEKIRSSHQRCSMKKGVLRNFAKFPGKYLCQSLFFNKVAALRPATLLKKRLAQVFSCKFCEISKNIFFPFLHNNEPLIYIRLWS